MRSFGLKNLLNLKNDILHLVYPSCCIVCNTELTTDSLSICLFCSNDLLFTYFEQYNEPTPLDQLFWGRVQVHATYSLLFFEKKKSTQSILHALKYKDNPNVGIEFGKMIGSRIKAMSIFEDLDALVFVPLHNKRQFLRGYNQSEQLAEGISQEITKPVLKNFLKRNKNSASQTKKGRFLRWDNVENKFQVYTNQTFKVKHIAIVDDVITTGSTLEVIIKAIKENNPEIRISVISLALAK